MQRLESVKNQQHYHSTETYVRYIIFSVRYTMQIQVIYIFITILMICCLN